MMVSAYLARDHGGQVAGGPRRDQTAHVDLTTWPGLLGSQTSSSHSQHLPHVCSRGFLETDLLEGCPP